MFTFYIIIYERKREEGEGFHLLVHSPSALSVWDLSEPELEAGNLIQVSDVGKRNQITWVITTASQGLRWLGMKLEVNPNIPVWSMGGLTSRLNT